MARPNFKAIHVRTLAELPDPLVKGRAYFIDDEGYIVIDHGDNRGKQVYGNKPGIQGIPGFPIPQLEGDIESLARAVILLAQVIHKNRTSDLERFAEIEGVIGALLEAALYKQNIDLDEFRTTIGDMISDVFNDEDNQDDAEGEMTAEDKNEIKEIINEIFG